MGTVKLSFKTRPQETGWDDMLAMWLEAEQIEHYTCGWLFDHFEPIFSDPTGPCFEGWTALSYLAGRTERLRLGLLVTGMPYRHPAVLANMAATFDVFSGGRLDLGLGAGWNEHEADAYGMPLLPLGARFDQFEEGVEIVDRLLRDKVTTFAGEYFELTEARCEPKPLQQPRPPFVIGGQGERRTLRIAERWADDWNFPGGPPDLLAHKVEVLHRRCAEVGRDPREITVSTHLLAGTDVTKTAADGAALHHAGADHLVVYFFDNTDPSLLGRTAEAILAAVR